jgi:hypothetical protein
MVRKAPLLKDLAGPEHYTRHQDMLQKSKSPGPRREAWLRIQTLLEELIHGVHRYQRHTLSLHESTRAPW